MVHAWTGIKLDGEDGSVRGRRQGVEYTSESTQIRDEKDEAITEKAKARVGDEEGEASAEGEGAVGAQIKERDREIEEVGAGAGGGDAIVTGEPNGVGVEVRDIKESEVAEW